MKYREIEYLLSNTEFENFISKNNLNVRIINYSIFLSSKCFVLEIFALEIEIFFYFTFYSNNFEKYSNVEELLKDASMISVNQIINKSNFEHTKTISTNKSVYEENLLKAEQHFFATISLMDELLSDFLSCKDGSYYSNFFQNSELKKNQLLSVF